MDCGLLYAPKEKNRLNIDVCLSNQDKIFGYVSNFSNFIPLNFILFHFAF